MDGEQLVRRHADTDAYPDTYPDTDTDAATHPNTATDLFIPDLERRRELQLGQRGEVPS
jgi:hypothetical protein